MSRKTEPQKLYVLYGSQTGNAEGGAKDFCELLQTSYQNAEFLAQHNLPPPSSSSLQVETTCLQLDDFLEMNHADYTKCLVIFVSSYGVGAAPLGSYRFRDLCDRFQTDNTHKILTGLQYAICGLGDSTYTTYLENPTAIDKGLTAVGASRIGVLGQCDANEIGDKAQDKVMKQWSEDILVPLAKALAETKEVDTAKMQAATIPLLVELDPDYTPPNANQKSSSSSGSGSNSDLCTYLGIGAVIVGGLAVIATRYT